MPLTARLILIFIFLFCLLQLAASSKMAEYTYEIFQVQYSRNYTGQERDKHKEIFLSNYQDVLEKRNNGESVEVNDLFDWNQTQLSQFFTYSPETMDIPLSSPPLMSTTQVLGNPSQMDYQKLGFTTSIKNQGSCGSCWAFAVAAQAQSLIYLHNQNGALYNLSTQYALQCQTNRSKGCHGGPPLYAQKMFVANGFPKWETIEYKGEDKYFTSRGINICSENNTIKFDQNVKVSGVNHYFKLSQQQIQDYLNKFGPLVVGVSAKHSSFKFAGKDGIINSCPSNSRVDHAVTLVGYTATHYKIKNSWGTHWGNKGYGLISKQNDCGLSTYIDVIEIQNSNIKNNINKNNNKDKGKDGNTINNKDTPGNLIKLFVTLTSLNSKGSMGTQIGFRQKGQIIARFGDRFVNGNSFGPQAVLIRPDYEVRVILTKIGRNSQQIGIEVKFENGTVVYTRKPGFRIRRRSILNIFCPSQACKINTKSNYTVKLKDSWGDTWNSASLAFKSGQDIQQFTLQKEGVKIEEPFVVELQRFTPVDVVIRKMGEDTEEIGYEIRNQFGELVAQRQPGDAFYPDDILSSFCTDCENLYQVEDLSGGDQNKEQDGELKQQQNKPLQTKRGQMETKLKEFSTVDKPDKPKQKTMVAVYILSIFLTFFMALTILTFVLLIKNKKEYQKIIENQKSELNEIMSQTRKHIEVKYNQEERIN